MGRVSLVALAAMLLFTGNALAAPDANSSITIANDGSTFRLELGGEWTDLPDEAKRIVLEQLKDSIPPAKLKEVLTALVAGKKKIEVSLAESPKPAMKVEADKIVVKKSGCAGSCGGGGCGGDVEIELLAEGDVVIEGSLDGEDGKPGRAGGRGGAGGAGGRIVVARPDGGKKRGMVILRGGDGTTDLRPELLKMLVERGMNSGACKSCSCSGTCQGAAKGHTFRRRGPHSTPQHDPMLRAMEGLRREIEGLRRDIRARHGGGCPNCQQAKPPAAPQAKRIMLRTTPGKTPPKQLHVGMVPGGAIAIGGMPASKEVTELRKQLAETKAAIRMLMKRITALEEKSR